MDEQTIHQQQEDAGGACCNCEWIRPDKWVTLQSHVIWLDSWYLTKTEYEMSASSESKWSWKGNMMNLGEKEIYQQERRSVWWEV